MRCSTQLGSKTRSETNFGFNYGFSCQVRVTDHCHPGSSEVVTSLSWFRAVTAAGAMCV
ncbi:hypothetical protein J6590_043601 [Homalodisca vitripennis]|nr:hypothetical protein J6590_043601 [Homalodisca vitripennis]